MDSSFRVSERFLESKDFNKNRRLTRIFSISKKSIFIKRNKQFSQKIILIEYLGIPKSMFLFLEFSS
ncbi:hypothetical protein DLM78_22745 [Leptospira stimsonii]|uniref:Uncharacterized protein n=1 Tax=Leptospira stimsonii TaxID=2202203 RepID=A0A8B3CHC9_9LEPT|nr:hypothetical protein DLM78_22745 [Leptospira stimsonii]